MRSVFTYLFTGLILLSQVVTQAQDAERKIIVEGGRFRFLTVDPETQLAHLHEGSVRQKINTSSGLPVPTGRSTEEPINPLAFSLHANELISVNWILHSLNSRYEAIRRIDLAHWRKRRPDWQNESWAEASFAQDVWAPNQPWEQMLADNNTLSDCFFDMISNGPELIMAVCNQGQLRLSRWNGKVWNIGKPIPYTGKSYFSLIVQSGKIAILSAEGSLYRFDERRNQLRIWKKGLKKDLLVVEDHDRLKNFLLDRQALRAQQAGSFESIIQESGIELNF